MPDIWRLAQCDHDGRLLVGVSRDNASDERDLHAHEFSEIVVVVDGKGHHAVGDSSYPICKGSVFVVNGDMVHGYMNGTGLVVENIIFSPGKLLLPLEYLGLVPGYHALFTLEPGLRRPLRDSGYMVLESGGLGQVLGLTDSIRNEIHTRAVGYEAAVQAHFLQLVLMLSRAYPSNTSQRNQAAYRMAEVLTYMEQNHGQCLRTRDLARMAHLSDGRFIKVFTGATGLTPMDYLIRLRVRKAARSLAETDSSITVIGSAMGFPSPSHFSRQFKRVMGVSPREYRARSSEHLLAP